VDDESDGTGPPSLVAASAIAPASSDITDGGVEEEEEEEEYRCNVGALTPSLLLLPVGVADVSCLFGLPDARRNRGRTCKSILPWTCSTQSIRAPIKTLPPPSATRKPLIRGKNYRHLCASTVRLSLASSASVDEIYLHNRRIELLDGSIGLSSSNSPSWPSIDDSIPSRSVYSSDIASSRLFYSFFMVSSAWRTS